MKKWSGDWEGKGEQRIVCAACLSGELIVVGPRHHDSTMQRQLEEINQSVWRENLEIQGFIDQFGDFYDRQEAWKIAEANCQILKRCGGDTAKGGTLFSENLY